MAAKFDNSSDPSAQSGKIRYSNYQLFVSSNLLNQRRISVARQNCRSDLDSTLTSSPITSVSASTPINRNADSTHYYVSGIISLVSCPASATWQAPTVDGYTFDGWYTIPSSTMYPASDPGTVASNYTQQIASAASTTWGVIAAGCNCWGRKTDFGSNKYTYNYKNYIKLKYTPKTVRVRYHANRGTGAPSELYTATFDTQFTVTNTKPTRSRYVFLGWSEDKDATTVQYTSGQKVYFPASAFDIKSGEIILYAVWQYGAVIAAFNAMGGTVFPRYLILMRGEKYGTLPTAHYGSESSSDWYTAAVGGELVTPTTTAPNSDHVLYSHWSAPILTHTLVFNANGGAVSPASRTVAEGAAYGTLPVPTRSGYTFVEWRTAPFLGALVTAATTMGDDDAAIYAIWTGIPFTVTLDANGGTVSPSTKTVPNGSVYGVLPVPTRSGWVFDGWYTAASGGTKIAATASPSASQTIYAHWHQQVPEGGSVQWII